MIHVTDIDVSRTSTQAIITARIRCQGSKLGGLELWLRYGPEYSDHLSPSADPWIAMLLWPAMRLGQNLRIDAPASSKLVEATPTLMDIMHCWDSRFRPIEIQIPTMTSEPNTGVAVASFFSGGVDSFYTALKNTAPEASLHARVTHLISAHGLDVPLDNEALWMRVRPYLQQSAVSLGCTWVECATNVRRVVPDELVPWSMYYGAVLAGIALGLRGLWSKALIPADQTYAEMFPSGSHPLLDPLWSSESVRIVNDGAEATRIEKISSRLARSDVALQHLRVCWENRGGKYNCGECEKCVRTMVGLKIAGVLDKCSAFDRPLDYRAVSSVRFTSPGQRLLMIQNYKAAQAAGSDPLLVRALGRSVAPSFVWRVRCALYQYAKHVIRPIDQLLFGGFIRKWYARTKPPRAVTDASVRTDGKVGD
jgi:hypothetical protein